jgi:hypothetical protein
MFIILYRVQYMGITVDTLPHYWEAKEEAIQYAMEHAATHHCRGCKDQPPRKHLCDLHKPDVTWKEDMLMIDDDGVGITYRIVELIKGEVT